VDSSFRSKRDKTEFWIFCAAVFLGLTTISTTSYFSVILARSGMSEREVGFVLSSPLVLVVSAILWSGPLISRFSALRVTVWGQTLCLLSFLTLQFTLHSPVYAGLSRMFLGLGFGIFFPAGMVYAKSKLQGAKTTHLFGIYATMASIPMAISPVLAETYLRVVGFRGLFFVLAIPLIAAIGMMLLLNREGTSELGWTKSAGYRELIKQRSIQLPICLIAIVGMLWGVVGSFMALVLDRSAVLPGYFFIACLAVLIAARVFLIGFLTGFSRPVIVTLGIFMMTAAYASLAKFEITEARTVVLGVFVGLGYSMTFPLLSVWVSDQFDADKRGRPVALFGAAFHVGIYFVPLAIGAMGSYMPVHLALLSIAVSSAALTLACLMLFYVVLPHRDHSVRRLNQV
jgi:MFS family permease